MPTKEETKARRAVLKALHAVLDGQAVRRVHVLRKGPRHVAPGGALGLRLGLCVSGERTHLPHGDVRPDELTWGPGEAVLTPAGVVHDTEYRRAVPTRTLGLVMKPDVVRVLDVVADPSPEEVPLRAGVPRFVAEIPRARLPGSGWHCLCALRDCDGHESEQYRVGLALNVFADVAWMVEHFEEESVLPTAYLVAREYVKEHFREPITRDRVARAAGAHPNHLSRLFREHGDRTFTEYLTELRLQRAAELLRNPQMPVKEIVEESGFGHSSQFHRCFRRRYGVSPRDYRAGMGGGGPG